MDAVKSTASRAVAAALWIGCAAPAFGQWMDQTAQLQAGWNAVYLEIDPAQDAVADAFVTDPPGAIEAVWTWSPPNEHGGLPCADPGDPTCAAQTGWRVWRPPGASAGAVNSLRAARGGEVYLIKTGEAASLTIRGTPHTAITKWRTGLNLVGFHVDSNNPPSFATYLAPSPYHGASKVFTILPSGDVVGLANLGYPIAAHRGYLVTCAGSTDYDGPVSIEGTARFGLEYGKHQVEHRVDLTNLADTPRTVSLSIGASLEPPPQPPDLPGNAGVIPMRVRDYLAQDVLYELTEVDEAHPLEVTLEASGTGQPQNARALLRLSVARQGQAEATIDPAGEGSQYQSILSINDGAGFLRRLPITAEVPRQAGLYVGTVSVDAVAWVQADARIVLSPDEEEGYENPTWDCNRNGIADAEDIAGGTSEDGDGNGVPDECEGPADTTTPRPTQGAFTFPVIVHFDGTGNYKFLNEVTILFQPGADEETPGKYVLATPDCVNCDQLVAGSIVDGEPFARRIATAAFCFQNDLPLTGGFGSTLQGAMVVASEDRLNPFRHTYHPNHDGDQPGEVIAVSRSFEFDFTCPPPEGVPLPPSSGDTLLTGCYTETLGGVWDDSGGGDPVYVPGLHKRDIHVSGRFLLRRISNIPALNDSQEGGVR